VGSNAAKSLAAALNKPLVGVHHMVCLHASPSQYCADSPNFSKHML
jgi:tRNA A37 threonylcarbamoyltransferase TsaD